MPLPLRLSDAKARGSSAQLPRPRPMRARAIGHGRARFDEAERPLGSNDGGASSFTKRAWARDSVARYGRRRAGMWAGMAFPYYGYETKHYGTEYGSHDVEVVFNKKLIVLNRAFLMVDGREVDRERIFYGDHGLETTLDDGTHIRIELGSGLVGELTKCVLVEDDGTEHPLQERRAAEPAR